MSKFLVFCFLLSIPLHWVAWSLDPPSLTTSTLITASCMCPLHQVTLLQYWMLYSRAWPPSSHVCWWINWNWTQIKLNCSLSGTNDSGANSSLCFLVSFLVSNLTLQNLLGILGVHLTYISPSAHIYQLSGDHYFTISRMLWCIRHYLDLDSAKLLATALLSSRLNYCNSLLLGVADTDLTKLQRVQRPLGCIVTMLPPVTHSVPLLHSLHWLPVKF